MNKSCIFNIRSFLYVKLEDLDNEIGVTNFYTIFKATKILFAIKLKGKYYENIDILKWDVEKKCDFCENSEQLKTIKFMKIILFF